MVHALTYGFYGKFFKGFHPYSHAKKNQQTHHDNQVSFI
jgi:hypothetical protein